MNQPLLNPLIFQGSKIYLGPAKKEDNQEIYQWYQDPEWFEMAYGGVPYAITFETVEKEEAEFNKDFGTSAFRIRELGTDRLVGVISLDGIDRSFGNARMNIAIGKAEDRGRGFGSEAIRLILNYGFNEMRLHRISLTVYEYNPKAQALYRRIGFKDEGRAREAVFRNGRFWDSLHMGVLRGEFNPTQ